MNYTRIVCSLLRVYSSVGCWFFFTNTGAICMMLIGATIILSLFDRLDRHFHTDNVAVEVHAYGPRARCHETLTSD